MVIYFSYGCLINLKFLDAVRCWVIENNYYIFSLIEKWIRNVALVSPNCLIFMLIWPYFLKHECFNYYSHNIVNIQVRNCSDQWMTESSFSHSAGAEAEYWNFLKLLTICCIFRFIQPFNLNFAYPFLMITFLVLKDNAPI